MTNAEIFERAILLPDFWERLEPYCFQMTKADLADALTRIGENQIVFIASIQQRKPAP